MCKICIEALSIFRHHNFCAHMVATHVLRFMYVAFTLYYMWLTGIGIFSMACFVCL